jgi:hypothetical protein
VLDEFGHRNAAAGTAAAPSATFNIECDNKPLRISQTQFFIVTENGFPGEIVNIALTGLRRLDATQTESPVENIWQFLRQNNLSNRAKTIMISLMHVAQHGMPSSQNQSAPPLISHAAEVARQPSTLFAWFSQLKIR